MKHLMIALYFLFACFGFSRSIHAQTNSEKLVQLLDKALGDLSKESFVWEEVREGIIKFVTDEDDPADPNIVARNGSSVLHFASQFGDTELIRFLHSRGAGLLNPRTLRYTPLGLAAYYGKVDAIRVLIELGADVNLNTPDGNSALSDDNTLTTAAVLVLLGAEINLQSWYDTIDPLLKYLKKRRTQPRLEVLLDFAVKKNDAVLAIEILKSVTMSGETILHTAVRNYRKRVLRLILAHQLSIGELESLINVPNNHGHTPLSLAVLNRNEAGLNLLLEAGATPETGNPNALALAQHVHEFQVPTQQQSIAIANPENEEHSNENPRKRRRPNPQSVFDRLLKRSLYNMARRLFLFSRGETQEELYLPNEIYGIIGTLMLSLSLNQ